MERAPVWRLWGGSRCREGVSLAVAVAVTAVGLSRAVHHSQSSSQGAPCSFHKERQDELGNVPLPTFLSSYQQCLCPWEYNLEWPGPQCNHQTYRCQVCINYSGYPRSLNPKLGKAHPRTAEPRSGCWQRNLLCFYFWQLFSRTNYFCILRWSDIKISQSMAWLH